MSALAITAALEALESGDVDLCRAILLGAREDGPSERSYTCPACGLGFEFPGQRDAHVERVHGFEPRTGNSATSRGAGSRRSVWPARKPIVGGRAIGT